MCEGDICICSCKWPKQCSLDPSYTAQVHIHSWWTANTSYGHRNLSSPEWSSLAISLKSIRTWVQIPSPSPWCFFFLKFFLLLWGWSPNSGSMPPLFLGNEGRAKPKYPELGFVFSPRKSKCFTAQKYVDIRKCFWSPSSSLKSPPLEDAKVPELTIPYHWLLI